MSKRRVVVTGLGMVTSVGLTVRESWKAILAGQSGVRAIQHIDVSNFNTKISASVQHFDPSRFMSVKDIRKTDVFIQYAVAAATEAMEDAALHLEPTLRERTGVAIGSGIGGLPKIEEAHSQFLEYGPRKISPFFIPAVIINMASGYVSIKYGLHGPNIANVTACTTGTHNIGLAARLISYGDADIMLAGGTEMATSALGVAGFGALRALSTRNDDPAAASRPWDKDRDGFVLGDGAGVLVLEEYEHAKKRGARIYAELAGFGMSGDASHITLPEQSGLGARLAMQQALRDAKLNIEDVDYINAHATSTAAGDELEVLAIKKTFGAYATKVAVSSTKSMIGHLLGAAGAVEAIFSVLAITDQVIPPTINLDNPDEGCDLDFVPYTARPMNIDVTLSNSFGFGGTNGCLIFKKI